MILACAVYAGQPDTLVLLGTAFVVFVAALLVPRATTFGGPGPIRRPLVDSVARRRGRGRARARPCCSPALQLISGSVRTGKNLSQAVSLQSLVPRALPGFRRTARGGKPVLRVRVLHEVRRLRRRHRGGARGAGASWPRWRLRWPPAGGDRLGAVVALAMAGIVYLPIVESALDGLPLVGSVLWRRATIPMDFALAVLAGMGTDVLVRSHRRPAVRRWLAVSFGVTAVFLVLLWAFGRGRLPPRRGLHPGPELHLARGRHRRSAWRRCAWRLGLTARRRR